MGSVWGTVATSNAARVVRIAREEGLVRDAHPIATMLAAARVPAGQMFDYWSFAARGLETSELPIAVAEKSCLEDLGLLGFLLLTAPSGLAALETFAAYGALLTDSRRWEVRRDGDRGTVELHMLASYAPSLGARISHEASFAHVVRGTRELCGEDVDPVSVSFRHARPRRALAHERVFRCTLVFDAPRDRIVYRARDLDVSPRAASPAMWGYLRSQADVVLRALSPRPVVVRAKEEVAAALLAGRVPDVASVAATLGTTERTLRRVLSRESVSFRRMVDDARKERAKALLRAPGVSITRAALDAGFADASAFSHACRRWFGRAPREVAGSGAE